MSGKGIAVAGSIVVDHVKNISCYPEAGKLSFISDVSRAVGGSVPNVGIDLKKIDTALPVYGMGLVGDDDSGKYVLSEVRRQGMDVSGIRVVKGGVTAFSDVMSEPSGERTFFHCQGLGGVFSPEDIDLDALDCDMLHVAYILLLPRFDAKDDEYGTVMARFLKNVRARGIKTSVDVVTAEGADYAGKVLPVLPYCDNIILNEIEACAVFGAEPYDEQGSIVPGHIEEVCRKMADAGVRERVIIHCPRAGFCLNAKTGKFTMVPSLVIPKEEIKGSVGAGDAFCAGSLYGIYKNWSDEDILRFASSAAACSLFAPGSVDGMRSVNEIRELEDKYGRQSL